MTNGDFISREAVLQKFLERGSGYIDMLTIKTMVDEIPSANVQPVPQWISIEERLPEENQKCLVYRDINADLKITTGIWHSDTKEFYGLRHGTRLEDTIAWAPLPEPPQD